MTKKQETNWRDMSKSVSSYEEVANEIKQELFKWLVFRASPLAIASSP